jgi:plasmid stabilization system protein ParE
MIVRYRERALLDSGELQTYIEERSPLGARNVLREIHRSIELIAEQPLAYQRTDDPDVRVKVVRRYRYKIFDTVPGEGTDEIIHVRHTSRHPRGSSDSG